MGAGAGRADGASAGGRPATGGAGPDGGDRRPVGPAVGAGDWRLTRTGRRVRGRWRRRYPRRRGPRGVGVAVGRPGRGGGRWPGAWRRVRPGDLAGGALAGGGVGPSGRSPAGRSGAGAGPWPSPSGPRGAGRWWSGPAGRWVRGAAAGRGEGAGPAGTGGTPGGLAAAACWRWRAAAGFWSGPAGRARCPGAGGDRWPAAHRALSDGPGRELSPCGRGRARRRGAGSWGPRPAAAGPGREGPIDRPGRLGDRRYGSAHEESKTTKGASASPEIGSRTALRLGGSTAGASGAPGPVRRDMGVGRAAGPGPSSRFGPQPVPERRPPRGKARTRWFQAHSGHTSTT